MGDLKLKNICIFPRKGFVSELSPSEKSFLLANPLLLKVIKKDADEALREAQNSYSAGLHNGNGDAFRHCYWSALLTRDIGERKALAFTNAHEEWCGNPSEEKTMDLYNNSIGIAIGRNLAKDIPNKTVIDLCRKALKDGKLKWLTP
jgi:hypothetical protein